MNTIEIIGFITAVLGIYLTAKKNIIAWPILIISSLAYAYFFYEIKLYADSILQFFFVATSIFAWFNWNKTLHAEHNLKVRTIKKKDIIGLLFLISFSGLIFSKLLLKFTDSSYAEYDSILFVASIVASILSAKMILENWYFWIVINLSYIILYLFKEAYLTAVLYSILIALAYIGLRDWKKQLNA